MSTLADQGITRTLARHGAIEPRHTAIAVLDESCVRVSDGRRFPLPSPFDRLGIGAVLASCHRHGLGQLWIHPRAERLLDWQREAWAGFRPLGSKAGREVPRFWSTCVLPGVYGGISLVRPACELAPHVWARAEDGRALLAGLCRFRLAAGVAFQFSGGSTAMELLRQTHTGRGTLTLPTPPPAIPPAVAEHRGSIEPDLIWLRPEGLTPAERSRRFLHCFDKNGCYLGACASLPIGEGEPVELDGVHILAAASGELEAPGYWRLDGADIRAVQPAGLPPLVMRSSYGPDDEAWVTTPTLRLLLDLGLSRSSIERGIIWPVHHQHLQRWYKQLGDARRVLADETRMAAPGAAEALAAVKRVYTRGLGWLGMRSPTWRTPTNPLARPDIPHMVRAKARANLIRDLLRLEPHDATPTPFAMAIDALYVVSDEADPAQAAPAGLRLGPGLGQWKAKWPAPLRLAEALPAIDSGRAGRFIRWLGDRECEMGA